MDIKSLAERCELRKNRPLLLNKNIKKELDKINNVRKSNFSKSHYIVQVSGKTKYQIAKEIIKLLLTNTMKNKILLVPLKTKVIRLLLETI